MNSLKVKLSIGLVITTIVITFILSFLIQQYDEIINRYETLTDNIAYIEEVVYVTNSVNNQLILLYSNFDGGLIEPINRELFELNTLLDLLDGMLYEYDSLYLYKRLKTACTAFEERAQNLIRSMESNNIVESSSYREEASTISAVINTIGLDLLTNELEELQTLKVKLKGDASDSKRKIIIIALAMMLVLIVSLLKFNSNIVKSVNYIVYLFREIGSGEFNVDIKQLTAKDEFKYIADEAIHMQQSISELASRNERSKNALIVAIGSLAEMRDDDTSKHIHNIQEYLVVLCQYLREHKHYREILTDKYVETLIQVSPLHDIGKVGVSDNILLKAGKLDFEEFEQMKKHVEYGVRVIVNAKTILQEEDSYYIGLAELVIAHHHEKWDGSGYPDGLSSDEISLAGRLVALVDVYDALSKKRVYKEAFSHEKSKEIILASRGTHFDPIIVDAFLHCEKEFNIIRDVQRIDTVA